MLLRLFNCASAFAWLLLLLLHLPASVSADDFKLGVESKRLDSPPIDIRYFEDSEVILAQEQSGKIWRSENGGLAWSEIDDIPHGEVASFWMNPYFNDWAVALGKNKKHWVTKDKGKSWHDFKIPANEHGDGQIQSLYRVPLSFHAFDPKKMIFKAQDDRRSGFKERAYYTDDGFKDRIELLSQDTKECLWVMGTPQVKPSVDRKALDNRILCIVAGDRSGAPEENKILVSDDYFKTAKESVTQKGRKIKGFVNVAGVKGYIIAAAKGESSIELSLMVSVDGENWHQGVFPPGHRVHEEAYTVMESNNYSIQVDVLNTRAGRSMGVLFSSDSDGEYFTENIRYTNRNMFGLADFEKITGAPGTIIVNQVKNWEEVERDPRIVKKLVSRITFDDGRTWNDLKDHDKNKLHLHSITDIANSGKVFSSPAPGLVMGVGNTGDHLTDYMDGDLWASDDAGLTWTKAQSGAHKYEFGDQGTILVAIDNERPTKEIKYSQDHGEDWKTIKFTDEEVRPGILTTIPDSTTRKFTLTAARRIDGKPTYFIYTLDFSKLYDKQCSEEDYEDWTPLDAHGEKNCVMGQTETYRRRKKKSKCYVGKPTQEAKPKVEPCSCADKDYECDIGYIPKGDAKSMTCELAAPPKDTPEECKNGKNTFEDKSGFRLIPGNTCKDGVKRESKKVDRPCDITKQPAAPNGKVGTTVTTFSGSNFVQKVYLERNSRSADNDETVVMSVGRSSTSGARIFYTRDHGKTWKPAFDEDENYQLIIRHKYDNDRVFFISPTSKKVIYSVNRMVSTRNFVAEHFMVDAEQFKDERIPPLVFHEGKPNYLIWTGQDKCSGLEKDCHTVTSISKDGGDHWETLAQYTRNCEFIERKGRGTADELIYCEQRKDEKPDGKLELRATTDLGASFVTKASDILAFATMSEFIIVAEKDPTSHLKLTTSVDGQVFAEAKFPHDFNVPVHNAFTVLDSSTHAVFLHVTTNSDNGFEYGRIVKSNSNGTFYITSLDYVNRDRKGFVDFEKMHGVDGVAMVNVVANWDEKDSGKSKKLRSLISHNDGAQWAPIKAPTDNPEGDAWGCDTSDTSDTSKCSLHLHSYTERDDAKHTFSSASAIGLMVAVGNVGEYLADVNDKDRTYTFISRDAGVNWRVAKKGRFLWEYGDQGSLVVLVEQGTTNFGYYTMDEGASWTRFELGTESKVAILDLTTAPSDNSKQFLVWFRNEDGQVGTVNLDFSSTKEDRECVPDEEHHGNDDYELWMPEHPVQKNDCLFGQKMQYLRKKPNAQCWNGRNLERLHGEPIPCPCARQDFECDYNYQRTADQECVLVPGSSPIDPMAVCRADPTLKTYYEGKGYRKLPISKCVDGEITKHLGEQHRCPGHENDPLDLPSERKGLSGFTFFLVAIVLPVTAAAGIGYLVWSRIQSGAGFGRIRLGETGGSSTFDADQPWIKYPIAMISGLVAIMAAIPLLMGAGWRALSSRFGGGRRYTSRQSFARGRGDYSIVDDEDELLGDDEEEL